MLYIVMISIAVGGYFAFRYISMLYAFKQIIKEVDDIQRDYTQNQILHLPIPNKHLGKLLSSFNTTLDGINKERQKYEKREKDFQRQIESISHDLRTPLTVILGYLKFIKQVGHYQLKEDSEMKETIRIIEHKAEIMHTLISQFYDYSRLDANDYKLTLHKVDISKTLKESLLGNYEVLAHSQLRVLVDIPKYPLYVLGDQSALERIFLNLFQNASRYADTYLQISIKENNEHLFITFINDTQKLLEEDVPYVFDRFYMQDSSRNQEGSGLGLCVAKALANEMSATLCAYTINKKESVDKKDRITICFELRMSVSDVHKQLLRSEDEITEIRN